MPEQTKIKNKLLLDEIIRKITADILKKTKISTNTIFYSPLLNNKRNELSNTIFLLFLIIFEEASRRITKSKLLNLDIDLITYIVDNIREQVNDSLIQSLDNNKNNKNILNDFNKLRDEILLQYRGIPGFDSGSLLFKIFSQQLADTVGFHDDLTILHLGRQLAGENSENLITEISIKKYIKETSNNNEENKIIPQNIHINLGEYGKHI